MSALATSGFPARARPPSILLVEDDRMLSASLKRGLEDDGYRVETVTTSVGGFQRGLRDQFQAFIVDIGLPDGCGIELVRSLRRQGVDNPILLLTARGDSDSIVSGLDAGADDYVVKPIPLAVLGARLRALHRRWHRPMEAPIRVGDLLLEPSRLIARRGDVEIDLTPTQAHILEALMVNAGNVLTRTQIADWIGKDDTGECSNVIDVHVGAVRAKIDAPFRCDSIETVRGFGYRMRSPAASA